MAHVCVSELDLKMQRVDRMIADPSMAEHHKQLEALRRMYNKQKKSDDMLRFLKETHAQKPSKDETCIKHMSNSSLRQQCWAPHIAKLENQFGINTQRIIFL
jgi:hypothetical protein